jgi:hypothetical protein
MGARPLLIGYLAWALSYTVLRWSLMISVIHPMRESSGVTYYCEGGCTLSLL